MKPTTGHVDLVGAGPGDPALLTLAARDALRSADLVVHDQLIPCRLLDEIPATARRVFVGKHKGHLVLTQHEINRLLITQARAGCRVVRLKGGDPYIFGRGGEEALALHQAHISFRVIPGITASLGVAAYAGIPLTHRHDASLVTFVTGHHDPESPDAPIDWAALATTPGTLVIYMGLAHLPALTRVLLRHGRSPDSPVALVQDGTRPDQKVITAPLAQLPTLAQRHRMASPTLLILGEVVRHHHALDWHARLPLAGRRILVTRPEIHDDSTTRAPLEQLGAVVLLAPTVTLHPLDDFSTLDNALTRLNTFDWVIFTSTPGVRFFFDRLAAKGFDARHFGSACIAAIGQRTAEALHDYHIQPDLIPESARSEGLLAALQPHVAGRRILLARADRGRLLLRDELAKVATVEDIAVYHHRDAESFPPHVQATLLQDRLDWITITSPAIVARLHALLPAEIHPQIGHRVRLASLSPLTTQAAQRLGWPVAATAVQTSWPGLIAALTAAERSSPSRGE